MIIGGGLSKKNLALESRASKKIDIFPNNGSLTPAQIAECGTTRGKFLGAKERTAPTSNFNFHGLTFGCRRGHIDDSHISRIINEDNFQKLSEADVLPGDAILWYNDPDVGGGVCHSGIVVELTFIGSVFNPKVVSKWGCCHEMVHALRDAPYDATRVTYHRIRS